MKFYYTKRSPYARKAWVIALEKDIPLELIEEDLANKSLALLKANPVGKIPTLVFDDGNSICDSSLICQYLDSLKDQPELLPNEPKRRLEILNFDSIAKNLTDVTVAAFYEKLIHPMDFSAAYLSNKEETIKRCLYFLNQQIDKFKGLNLASISVSSAIGYIEFRHGYLWPQKSCQRLNEWYDEFCQRPSMKQTIPVG